jgi:hypothetical protein
MIGAVNFLVELIDLPIQEKARDEASAAAIDRLDAGLE